MIIIRNNQFLKGLLKPYKVLLLFGILAALIAAVFGSVQPYLLKILIDDVYSGKQKGLLEIIVGIYLISLILMYIIDGIKSYIFLKVSHLISVDLRTKIISKINSLPINILEKFSPGELSSKTINDVSTVSGIFNSLLPHILSLSFRIIVSVPILFYLEWKMACLLFVLTPLFWYVGKAFHNRIRSTSVAYQETLGIASQKVNESYAGAIDIRTYRQQDWDSKNAHSTFDKVKKAAMLQFYPTMLNQQILSLLFTIPLVSLYYWGGKAIFAETLTIGEAIAFTQYFTQVMAPINMLLNINSEAQTGLGVSKKIEDFLDQKTEERLVNNREASLVAEYISVDNISYKFDEGERGLSTLSANIPLGKVTVIVGENGVGKTTFSQILAKFRLPSEGTIDYGAINYSDIVYVPHTPYTFSDTVEENISFGRPFSRQDVKDACTIVGLHHLIESLPQKYNTKIGPGNQSFSAGQLQRLSLARLLLNPSRVVVFDEALSNIDEESQHLLFNELRSRIDTIIFVTHNMEQKLWADYVVDIKTDAMKK